MNRERAQKISDILSKAGIGAGIRLNIRLIGSYVAVLLINAVINGGALFEKTYITDIGTLTFAAVFLSVFLFLTIINIIAGKWYTDIVMSGFLIYSYFLCIVFEYTNVYLCIILIFITGLYAAYMARRYPKAFMSFTVSQKFKYGIIGFFLLLFLLYIGTLAVLRYLIFKSPGYDFGIFSQMFRNMKETFMPLVTCERDTLMSHFEVHISPVLYLILPVYYIFPYPVTLLVMQVIIVASGVFPLYLICKKRCLSNFFTTVICVVYLTYPALMGGFFYDFHENKFLAPLILWLLFFFEKRNYVLTYVFAFLTMSVKEDAPIYTACIGIYILLSCSRRKDRMNGYIIAVLSVLYFMSAVLYLNRYGYGVMSNRYDNYLINPEDGIFSIIPNIIKNPAYLFSQLLNQEKLQFLLWMMLPLMFVPLCVKKLSHYVLLIPFLLINLMTNYEYQYNIYFQYTYGSSVLLFYLAVLFFEGKETWRKKYIAVMMATSGIIMSVSAITPRNYYITDAVENMDTYNHMREMLETHIPKDVSVAGSPYLIAALSDRREVYVLDTKHSCDYVAYDLRTGADEDKVKRNREEKLLEGYVEIYNDGKNLCILRIP